MRHTSIIGLLVLAFALLVVTNGSAQDPKRIEYKKHADSTELRLTGFPNCVFYEGDAFTVHVHVSPGQNWEISSLRDHAGCECSPLQVLMPEMLAPYFKIVSFEEQGRIVSDYDSDMAVMRSYHREPFDLAVTISVTEAVAGTIPFRLFLRYMAINKTSKQCLPPFWYNVPARKDPQISTRIEDVHEFAIQERN